ncbi:MAG: hypothetical protein AAFX52_11890 [Pseudomonadota bacterium]
MEQIETSFKNRLLKVADAAAKTRNAREIATGTPLDEQDNVVPSGLIDELSAKIEFTKRGYESSATSFDEQHFFGEVQTAYETLKARLILEAYENLIHWRLYEKKCFRKFFSQYSE